MPPTKIEFTHFPGTTGCTWNLWAGCTKESAGCTNCWALPMSLRLAGSSHPEIQAMYEGTVKRTEKGMDWTGLVRFNSNRLKQPDGWKARRTVFVQSMGDIFHGKVLMPDLYRVFCKMLEHPEHTFLLLTKRPQNAVGFFSWWAQNLAPLPTADAWQHIWFGITMEHEFVKKRLHWLKQIPLPHRWLNYEPAIGFVKWDFIPRSAGIEWVVAGGESAGRRARPPDPDWFRHARDFCRVEGIPFLFKQWGNWAPVPDHERRITDQKIAGHWMRRYPNKKSTGRTLDGRIWNEFPDLTT